MIPCLECGTAMEKAVVSLDSGWGQYKVTFHGLKAEKCPLCDYTLFDSYVAFMTQEIAMGLSKLPDPPVEVYFDRLTLCEE